MRGGELGASGYPAAFFYVCAESNMQCSTVQLAAAGSRRGRRGRGFTLVEAMVSAVMALLATTLAALATAVQVANQQPEVTEDRCNS